MTLGDGFLLVLAALVFVIGVWSAVRRDWFNMVIGFGLAIMWVVIALEPETGDETGDCFRNETCMPGLACVDGKCAPLPDGSQP